MTFTDTTNYSLGSPKDAQKQIFGKFSTAGLSDMSEMAYNYMMKQQDNALMVALMNYQNEYNTPLQQMLRRQQAGINPYAEFGVQNSASFSPAQTQFKAGASARKLQAATGVLDGILNTVAKARDIYDYARYGKDISYFKRGIAQNQSVAGSLQNEWEDWLLHGENMIYGDSTRVPNGPKAKMYKNQSDAVEANTNRVKALIDLIPDQKTRTAALAALDQYRLQILQGQNDAILKINTGNAFVDSVIKSLIYLGMNKL